MPLGNMLHTLWKLFPLTHMNQNQLSKKPYTTFPPFVKFPPDYSVIFYIRHGFDGNGSAQCIFASMFRHSDVRLRHQISGTKGLNQGISVPLFCHVVRLRHQISVTKGLNQA